VVGCAIGGIVGMVIATALGWGNTGSIVLSVALVFVFGYSLIIRPVLRAGCRSAALPGSPSRPTPSR
jgi:hypothetical protein